MTQSVEALIHVLSGVGTLAVVALVLHLRTRRKK